VVSSKVFAALGNYLWKLTYKWACWNHSNKPKRWIVQRYYGKFDKFRADRWVFGDRDTGAYLPNPAWTDIVRHTLVKGRASVDDPDLTRYWAQRRRKVKPPLDSYTVRLMSKQDGRCTLCGDDLLTFEDRPPDPAGLGVVVPLGHQEGDRGGLPRPPRSARYVTRSTNTPGTRPLLLEASCPGSSGHHDVAEESPNRPRGLPGPYAWERARTVLKGPRRSNASGLPG